MRIYDRNSLLYTNTVTVDIIINKNYTKIDVFRDKLKNESPR